MFDIKRNIILRFSGGPLSALTLGPIEEFFPDPRPVHLASLKAVIKLECKDES